MREIGMKRDTWRNQLPLHFWACEIGAKWWAKRIRTYVSPPVSAKITCPEAQEAPGELSIVLVSHGLPP